jgi:hypothetical protein
MRFLLSKMNPPPNPKEMKAFLAYNSSEVNSDILIPNEVMGKMKEE